ncbi:unsaturated rhamnogalacturonan hydrolase [Colletotrichum graminicola]|uniref:Unsaturated rhamnogalacturonan hydrolase n=1 Tax=Colletotrichum graminicola (strain M1.001 / M2 / FGSC 10212) TaxID=645133 RepID=E3QL16_COLGM|nr:unsaturated rhamnogalacturonan hydrolase [Colletotrichum graminicola M1.001]EFQ31554.1 unsaturated rhamnogalacturonan hydrolase [Colletotrichum graminicola M1.001]WDK10216.1 unsaturated rhamnogalacturonan hydrolase [Colletotrichum graminicola]
MRAVGPLLALASSLALASTCAARPYSEWLASSFVARNALITRHYDPAVLYEGIARAADTAVSSLLSRTRACSTAGTRSITPSTTSASATTSSGSTSAPTTPSTGSPSTPCGGFWHRAPIYEDHMWLDGIYMADAFYAAYVSLFEPQNATAWDEIALQFDLVEELPAYRRLLGYFATLADGLERSQDDGGGWWLIMDEGYEARRGNYIESSAAAMYKGVGFKAYDLLTSDFIRDDEDGYIRFLGTVQVGSLNSNASFEYYTSIPVVDNDARGGGAFLFVAIEAEQA